MSEKLFFTTAVPSGFAGGLIDYITGNFMPMLALIGVFCFFDCIVKILIVYRETGDLPFNEIVWNLVQKLFYFMVVTVAFGLDYTIYQTTNYLYGDILWKAYFGTTCIAIVIATEGLDILINLEQFDINIPFLKKAFKLFKEKIQEGKK